MIFLNDIENMKYIQNPCYIDNITPFSKKHAILIPTTDEDLLYTLLKQLRNKNWKVKIKSVDKMYIPKKNMGQLGNSKLNYNALKFFKEDSTRAKQEGFGVGADVAYYQEYNVVLNLSRMMKLMSVRNLNPGTAGTYAPYMLNQFARFFKHESRTIIFTPEICRVNYKNDATIRATAFKTNNFYIKLLHQFKFNFPFIAEYMRSNNIKLIFTDHAKTFMVDFSDEKLREVGILEGNETLDDKKVRVKFSDRFFKAMKKLNMAYATIEETIGEINISDYEDDDEDSLEVVSISRKKVNKEDMDNIEKDMIVDTVSRAADFSDTAVDDELEKDIIEKLSNKDSKSDDVTTKLVEIIDKSKGVSDKVPEKLVRLQKRQLNIIEKNKIDLLEAMESINNLIIPEKIENTTVDRFNKFSIKNQDTQYEEKFAQKDRLSTAESLNKTSVPLFLTNYKEKETTLDTTKAKDVQFTFESPMTKEKHTFTVAVPELRDGKFLHLNGSDKVMVRQKIALPVIKLTDAVMITTYYNKVTVTKTVGNLTPFTAKIKSLSRFLKKNVYSSTYRTYFDLTPAIHIQQKKNILPFELLEISRFLSKITIDETNFIDFNFDRINKRNRHIIGYLDGNEVTVSKNSEDVYIGEFKSDSFELLDNLIQKIDNEEIRNIWNKVLSTTSSKNITYNKATMLKQNIPILYVILIAENFNLFTILERAKKDYGLEFQILPFVKGRKQPPAYKKSEGDTFLFDGFTLNLKYNNIPNRALFAPLLNVDLTEISKLSDMEMIIDNEIRSNTRLYIENYVDLLIDPITQGVLKEQKIADDFTGVFMYANALMFYYDRERSEISLKNERMPSISEIVQGALIKVVYDAYGTYSTKRKRGARNPSFSIEKNAVINVLNTLPNVEESSKINPVQHVDKLYTVSSKGLSGVNNDRSYTMTKRMWDKSNYGVMSAVSPYDKGTGIKKHLSVNPNITDVRGYFNDNEQKINDIKADKLYSVSEALAPFATRHDSSARIAMAMQQSNHMVGTNGSEPALVSYGMDESIGYLDSDFAFHAKYNGEVTELNDKFIKIKYDKGNKETEDVVFPLDNIERNSAKSFYISNEMTLNSDLKLKVGKKVKQGDVIAYNRNLYSKIQDKIVFKSGPIVHVAISHTQHSYEDAILISETLAKKMGTKTVKKIMVKLGPHDVVTNFNYKIGSKITSGDLMISYNKDSNSDVLNNIFNMSAVNEYIEKKVESYYTGTLKDIYVTYKLTGEKEENLDPSIKKIIENVRGIYNTKYKNVKMAQNIPKYEINRIISHVSKLTDTRKNKVNGVSLDKNEILIEFFIETEETFTIGDKLTAGNAALKGIVSKVIPDSERPKGVKTGRVVDAILSPYSPLARMVTSIFKTGIITEVNMKVTQDIVDILNEDD